MWRRHRVHAEAQASLEPRWVLMAVVMAASFTLGYIVGDARSPGDYGRAKQEIDLQQRIILQTQEELRQCTPPCADLALYLYQSQQRLFQAKQALELARDRSY